MIDEDKSLAEVSDREKNRISHRARAMEKLAAELKRDMKNDK